MRPTKRQSIRWIVRDYLPNGAAFKYSDEQDANSEPQELPLHVITPSEADQYHQSLVAQDDGLAKYYAQRYDLYERYDEGILLDAESWYSITPESIARHHARKILHQLFLNRFHISMKDLFPDDSFWTLSDDELRTALYQNEDLRIIMEQVLIVDGFCGAGGNAIQFARLFNQVIALDIDPVKIYLARHNAFHVYQIPQNRIAFYTADFFEFLPWLEASLALSGFVTAVYLSPPWGGPAYQSSRQYDVSKMMSRGLHGILEAAAKLTPNLAVFLPRNTPRNVFAPLAKRLRLLPTDAESDAKALLPWTTIEENFLNTRLKAITVYYGDLATSKPACEEAS